VQYNDGFRTQLIGTPEQVAARIVEYRKLGVDLILTGFLHYHEEIERFGRHVLPIVRAHEVEGGLDPAAVPDPAAHFGPDLSPVVLAEVIWTIAATDPAIAQIPQAHFLFVDVLAVHGSAAQQERLFADVLAGARLGNGLAERGGQHAQDLKTRLVSGAQGLRLEGRKCYCTGAISARWIGVSALDDDGRLVLAFVERDAPGVTVGDDWNVMGQRATVSGSAVFDHVPVDPGLVIPYAGAFEVP
jgi:alkylation response protein AidB-like acyl-CoA dehydrogenase